MLNRLGAAWSALLGRSLNNPTLSLNDAGVWGDSYTTSSGVSVTHESALRYAPVYQSVSLISGDLAKLPLSIYKRQPELGPSARDVDKKHPAYKLVRRQANADTSALKFWRRFFVSALLWNNAYAFIEWAGNGRPVAIYNLLPDRTKAERVVLKGAKEATLVYTTEYRGPNGESKLKTLFPWEVLHVEGVCLDNLNGCDLVKLARDEWALGLALEGFAAKFFRQGARVGGVLEIPNTFTREAATNLEQGFTQKHTGPDNWFRVAILREGAKFHSTTVSPNDAALVEAGEAVVRQVARHFNLPPAKLGLNDSVSYGSLAESNQAYLDSTLAPWLCAAADECNSKLLTISEQNAESHYFEHNTSKLLAMDALKAAQIHAVYIRNQIMSPDEVRATLNMNPRPDGKGGEYLTPGAPSPAAVGGSNDQQSDNDGPKPENAKPESERAHNARRVVFNIGARARHKAKRASAFNEWVAGDLRYHRDEYARLVGDGRDVVTPIAERFKRCVGLTGDALCNAVDDICFEIEGGEQWQD